MMKISVLLVLCLLLSAFSAAQEFPQVEVFGGYSYMSFANAAVNLNGWNGAMQYNVNRTIGLKADVSGHYDTPYGALNSYSFLLGLCFPPELRGSPPFYMRLPEPTGLVQALTG